MYIVILEDGTIYSIDTSSDSQARRVVEYKLRQRSDYRKIKVVQQIKGAIGDKNSKYYNSGNEYDREDLHCSYGWSYKW